MTELEQIQEKYKSVDEINSSLTEKELKRIKKYWTGKKHNNYLHTLYSAMLLAKLKDEKEFVRMSKIFGLTPENIEIKSKEDSTVIKTIKDIPQQPQVQYSLQQQLQELRFAANKLGLYDAADFLKNK